MSRLAAKTANCGFGRLIDLAHAISAAVAKQSGRAVRMHRWATRRWERQIIEGESMRWVAACERHADTVTLEKRLLDPRNQFTANSGLKAEATVCFISGSN